MLLHHTRGSVVYISSISVHTGYNGLAMYASSKGALEAFSKDTAREWGGLGIRSNVVVPGFMETAMSSTLTEEQKDRIYKRTSLKAATSVYSVAETVAFLLSEKSCSITGQNIYVDNSLIVIMLDKMQDEINTFYQYPQKTRVLFYPFYTIHEMKKFLNLHIYLTIPFSFP